MRRSEAPSQPMSGMAAAGYPLPCTFSPLHWHVNMNGFSALARAWAGRVQGDMHDRFVQKAAFLQRPSAEATGRIPKIACMKMSVLPCTLNALIPNHFAPTVPT